MIGLELTSKTGEKPLRLLAVPAAVCLPHDLTGMRYSVSREMLGNVPGFVDLAALNESVNAENVAHGRSERLASVDHDEHRTICANSALADVREQRGTRDRAGF